MLLVGIGAFALFALIWLSRPAVSRYFFRRGVEAKQHWSLQESISNFDWALKVNPRNDAARLERAHTNQLRGHFTLSQLDVDQLLANPELDSHLRVSALNAAGINHFSFALPDQAVQFHNESLQLAQQQNLASAGGEALVHLSRVLYHLRGEHERAVSHLEEALKIGRETGDLKLQADALRNLGVVFWWFKAELDRPLAEFYLPALELYRRANDRAGARSGEATTLSNISLIYAFKGDIFEALNYQNQSVEIRRQIGDSAGLADSYLTMGQFFTDMENHRKASAYFQESLKLAEGIGYKLTQNEVEVYLAAAYVHLGEPDLAIPLLVRAVARERDNPVLARYRYAALANGHRLKGDHESALHSYRQALEINGRVDTPDLRFVGAINLYIADSLMAQGDWEEAGKALSKARDVIAEPRDFEAVGVLAAGLIFAQQARHEGRENEAIQHLQRAADLQTGTIVKSSTSFVAGPDRRLTDRLFRFLLEPRETPTTDESVSLAFRFLEQARYRTFRNFILQIRQRNPASTTAVARERQLLMRIDDLNRQLHSTGEAQTHRSLRQTYDEYEDLVLRDQLDQPRREIIRASRPVELVDLQRSLDRATAVVEYVVAGEQVFAIVVRHNRAAAVVLPETATQLRERIHLFSNVIFNEQVKADRDWKGVSMKLHKVLIAPLKERRLLDEATTLCLIPFSFLHEVPFAALLNDAAEERFLVEDFSLFRAPSATYLHQRILSPQKSDPSASLLALAGNSSHEHGLPPLESALTEIEQISPASAAAMRLSGPEASESRFKQMASGFSRIHFASHGIFEPDMPLLSRILLRPTSEDDGLLTVREVFDLSLNADLVTLSACETGRSFSSSGTVRSEIDRIGLIEAFLHAGARGVLATLLPVSDRATTEFMKTFYQRLSSTDKTTALAETQRLLIQGKVSYPADSRQQDMRHPRYWAPFILVGDSH